MMTDIKDIEQYLSEIRKAIITNRYRIERNEKRQENANLFTNYVINESKA